VLWQSLASCVSLNCSPPSSTAGRSRRYCTSSVTTLGEQLDIALAVAPAQRLGDVYTVFTMPRILVHL